MASTPDPVRTLGGLLEERAAEHGDETCFSCRGIGHSYAELDARSNAIGNELLASGVTAGDVVCVFMYNRPEYLYTIFALAKIGAIAAPIDTRFSGETLTYVLSETSAEVVVLDADTVAEYEAVRSETDTISTEFFVGDSPTDVRYRDFDLLLDGDGTTAPDVDVSGTDTCSISYVQRYRSGRPVGVRLPHNSYLNTGRETCRRLFELSADDNVFTTLPLYSCYPIQMGLVPAMITGAEFDFEKQFDRDRFWEWIRTYDATVVLYLGRMLSVLYNQQERDDDAENPVEYAVGHGFALETDGTMIANFERRFDVSVLEAYGLAPSATLVTVNRPDDRQIGSVGRPASYVELKIVDEDDWEVPTGERGEIVFRSTRPNTMLSGFHGDDELISQVCRNRWIHTNDVGYVDGDGYLYFVGSKTDTIHLGRVGGRISSLEIESVIDSYPAVRESAVFGVSNDQGEEAIKAVVVPEEGTTVSPIEISEHCEKQLTFHKLPRYVEVRSELPRAPSGKVRKDRLRATGDPAVWDRESGYDLNR